MIKSRAETTAGAGTRPRALPRPSSEPQRTTPTPRCAARHPTAPRHAAPRHATLRYAAPHHTKTHYTTPRHSPLLLRNQQATDAHLAASAWSRRRPTAKVGSPSGTVTRPHRRDAAAVMQEPPRIATTSGPVVLTLRVHHSPHLNKGRNEAQATKTGQKEKRASGVRTLDPRPHCAIVCGPLTYHLELTRRTKGVLFTVPPAI